MAGEWIPEKARGLMGTVFPGAWDEVQAGIFQGRCPGEHLHHGTNAPTDCRVHVAYGAAGQPPGIYCLHSSCKGVLDGLNETFRNGIFAKDENWKPSKPLEEGVVLRAPRAREAWIPAFSIGKLRGLVQAVPPCGIEFFMERSPIDPRKITSGEFVEHVFRPGERALIFTNFQSQGDYLWEVGRGGYRLAEERGVAAVRSKLPVDGGADGVWYLSNPVDGQWHANPRRQGRYSRRSEEAVTGWRHLVVECDEEKTLRKHAAALKVAQGLMAKDGPEEEKRIQTREYLEKAGGEKWAAEMMLEVTRWEGLPERMLRDAESVPGLWLRLLAMSPLAIKAIYSSGGDSWHALVEVNMATKADFDAYLRSSAKRFLPIIGADPGAMTPVRLTRLPGCTRRGKEQRLIYLNPAPTAQPIRDLAVRRAL